MGDVRQLPAPLPGAVRWARTRGWLLVYDAEMHCWHEIPADAAPRWWRWAAQEAKKAELAMREA